MDGRQVLQVLDKWAYWGLAWGNYQGEINVATQLKGSVKSTFSK